MESAVPITKEEFYRGKIAVAVEWWLAPGYTPPNLYWARLRVFSDGTADACWKDGGTVYGFDKCDYAGFFLSEDEYTRFARWTVGAEDFARCEDVDDDAPIPHWPDRPEQGFKYLGTY